ncbi:APG6-domain-containing protein [Collybia nuda]|uniref:APG6-domain-containing protein n=1 Tax=Collybia nuda TaxID=64659 RepID=A0A9P6CK31_9AGAR|nr:APG6-domain-containing protein [Collybia nuda]
MSYGPIVCQQCKEPMQLDASLIDLAPSAYDMIAATLPPLPPIAQPQFNLRNQKPAQLNVSTSVRSAWQKSRNIGTSSKPPLSLSHAQKQLAQRATALSSPLSPNESFVLLQDSVVNNIPSPIPSSTRTKNESIKSPNADPRLLDMQIPKSFEDDHHPSPLSHHLRSTAKLFNLLSTRTEIDHPLCAECTQILLTTLQRQLDETKRERDGYIAFEKEVRKERERDGHNLTREEVDKKIERLKGEERSAIEQLKEAERECQQLDQDLKDMNLDEKALEIEETEFWKVHNEHLLAVEQQNIQLATLRAAYVADTATLEKLERTNVYNDAFCIGHDGVFGTINGLRLGRVPGVPVEWAEINAAWGQTLLLLYTIARKLDYTFENYRLVPMGSFSRIEKTTGDKTAYELYGSGDLHLGRLLHNRRFDIAMVAFLDCLKHLIDHAKSQDPNIDFPHQISKDRIGDVSVKLQFNQEETWTRSLRHVLLALKICLKWTTNGTNG